MDHDDDDDDKFLINFIGKKNFKNMRPRVLIRNQNVIIFFFTKIRTRGGVDIIIIMFDNK